jgi:hypothetical protein
MCLGVWGPVCLGVWVLGCLGAWDSRTQAPRHPRTSWCLGVWGANNLQLITYNYFPHFPARPFSGFVLAGALGAGLVADGVLLSAG